MMNLIKEEWRFDVIFFSRKADTVPTRLVVPRGFPALVDINQVTALLEREGFTYVVKEDYDFNMIATIRRDSDEIARALQLMSQV
jgi:hypothetical protein